MDANLDPGVAQATRLYRPATRRTTWSIGSNQRFTPRFISEVPVGGSPTGAGESPALPPSSISDD